VVTRHLGLVPKPAKSARREPWSPPAPPKADKPRPPGTDATARATQRAASQSSKRVPYSWSRVIQRAARRASRRSPQPPVNNSAQTQISPVNNAAVCSRIPAPFARGAGVTNSRPQASSFEWRLSHPGASPRPKTNPQMTSANSHPIRTSLDLGPRARTYNPILSGVL